MHENLPSFTGNYKNAPDASEQVVKVLVEPEGLQIQIDKHTVYFWPAHQIHPHAFRKGDQTILSFGSTPTQTLEVVSPTFADLIKATYPDAVFHRNALPAPKSQKGSLYFLVLLMLGGLVAAYFLLLPLLSDWLIDQLPPQAEVKIGEKLYAQLLSDEDIDSASSVAVNQFLQQLELQSNYPLQVTVVRKESVNAFALPGGHMVIYTGLLDSLQSPAELAALLGHEFAHAQNRHSLRGLARSMSTYLLVTLLFNDVSGLAAVVLENADKLESLRYSRSLEKEADTAGFQVLQENKLDPNGMQQLFQRLQASSTAEAQTPALLSTHPLTSERLAHLQDLIQEQPYAIQPNSAIQRAWGYVLVARQDK
ncbi:M48 family metallopeptidase [Rufibacter roseus]|uniref:M48 family metallopeptidase n=1 Tax=Rufibacter roseus TaxID=1567108 RepID=A0ABW2DJ73_9BACT|nr:M48 family metallopeptidase [Rufibacter roseus]